MHGGTGGPPRARLEASHIEKRGEIRRGRIQRGRWRGMATRETCVTQCIAGGRKARAAWASRHDDGKVGGRGAVDAHGGARIGGWR